MRDNKEKMDEYGYPQGMDKTGLSPKMLERLTSLKMTEPLKVKS